MVCADAKQKKPKIAYEIRFFSVLLWHAHCISEFCKQDIVLTTVFNLKIHGGRKSLKNGLEATPKCRNVSYHIEETIAFLGLFLIDHFI